MIELFALRAFGTVRADGGLRDLVVVVVFFVDIFICISIRIPIRIPISISIRISVLIVCRLPRILAPFAMCRFTWKLTVNRGEAVGVKQMADGRKDMSMPRRSIRCEPVPTRIFSKLPLQ